MNILDPLDPDARMDAYYYSFERTGVGIIDKILSAVAIAGKGAHSTEWWDDDEDKPTFVDRIQQAANEAAEAIRASTEGEQS